MPPSSDIASPATQAEAPQSAEERVRTGTIHGLAAYFLWGLFPLFFHLLNTVGAVEIVAYRVICSLVFCLIILTLTRQLGELRMVYANRRASLILAGAGVLVTANWLLYIYAIVSGHTLDGSMGYFINPLVSALLGVIFLGERLRPLQWLAFVVGGLAVAVLILGYGQVPWIALGLALSFGLYALIKKQVGAVVPPLPGLAVETSAVTPLAIGFLIWWGAAGHGTAMSEPRTLVLLMLAGPVTAIPLLLFASATARIPMTTVGFLQYVSPILQFLCGWAVFGEYMPPARWAGFVLIWVAVLIFVLDSLHASRMHRRALHPVAPPH